MNFDKPEALAKAVMTTCVNCDQCRELMEDAPCQYFPRLFNLADRAKAGGAPASARDLADLVDLCNAFGAALVSTSANRAGEPAALAIEHLDPYIIERVDAVLAGDTGGLERPTDIRDARSGAVLRL